MKGEKTFVVIWHTLYLFSVMFKILMAIVIYNFLIMGNSLAWNILITILGCGYISREVFLFVTLNKELQNGRN